MTHIESLAVVAQATFGRDGALFAGLLSFVSQLSVVLWTAVAVTVIVRYVGTRIYQRAAARASAARMERAAPPAPVRNESEHALEAIGSAKGPGRAPRHRRTRPRLTVDRPLHAASTREG